MMFGHAGNISDVRTTNSQARTSHVCELGGEFERPSSVVLDARTYAMPQFKLAGGLINTPPACDSQSSN